MEKSGKSSKLVGDFQPISNNIGQNLNLPQVGVKIKKIFETTVNHQPENIVHLLANGKSKGTPPMPHPPKGIMNHHDSLIR